MLLLIGPHGHILAGVLSSRSSAGYARSVRAHETVHAEPRQVRDHPTYRVNFWERPWPDTVWQLDAFALTEANDVAEAMQWAEDHARGRRFELFVEADDEAVHDFQTPRQSNLIRLAGTDPNDGVTVEVRFEKID